MTLFCILFQMNAYMCMCPPVCPTCAHQLLGQLQFFMLGQTLRSGEAETSSGGVHLAFVMDNESKTNVAII